MLSEEIINDLESFLEKKTKSRRNLLIHSMKRFPSQFEHHDISELGLIINTLTILFFKINNNLNIIPVVLILFLNLATIMFKMLSRNTSKFCTKYTKVWYILTSLINILMNITLVLCPQDVLDLQPYTQHGHEVSV